MVPAHTGRRTALLRHCQMAPASKPLLSECNHHAISVPTRCLTFQEAAADVACNSHRGSRVASRAAEAYESPANQRRLPRSLRCRCPAKLLPSACFWARCVCSLSSRPSAVVHDLIDSLAIKLASPVDPSWVISEAFGVALAMSRQLPDTPSTGDSTPIFIPLPTYTFPASADPSGFVTPGGAAAGVHAQRFHCSMPCSSPRWPSPTLNPFGAPCTVGTTPLGAWPGVNTSLQGRGEHHNSDPDAVLDIYPCTIRTA